VKHRLILEHLRDNRPAVCARIAAFAFEVGIALGWVGIVRGMSSHPTAVRMMTGAWLSVLLLFLLVVGFVFLAIERYFDVLEYAQEFGILRVLGAPYSYFLAILFWETVVVAVPGTVVGIGLTYLARAVIAAEFTRFWTLEIVYTWWPIAGAFSAAGSLLGAIVGAHKAVKNGLVQAMSYEK
jgi:ABC-type antimicrobial peptide transport system permease subunit